MTDRELMQQALEALEPDWELAEWYVEELQNKAITALRERLAQPEFDAALQSAAMTQTAPKLAQPEQSPLDRMAENARELGLDYEPVQKEKPDGLQTTGPLTDRTDHVRNGGDYTPEPVAMRYDFDGYGYRYIDSGSGSNWQTRIKDAEPLYAAPQPNTIANSEAIPEQISEPVQEPVAWWLPKHPHPDMVSRVKWSDECEPLYTTPPRREWQGLTDEVDELAREMVKGDKSVNWLIRAIEAKLKEKNA